MAIGLIVIAIGSFIVGAACVGIQLEKGKRIQWLVGFDMLGFMQVTTPAQVRKSRSGFNCNVTNWNVLLEENFPKLDWFLSAKYTGTELEK